VERRGVRVYEQTAVTGIRPGVAETGRGRVRAEVVIRGTEGYPPTLPGLRRAIAPVYSLMLATEPLPRDFWDAVGLRRRETFTDYRHLIVYGQRTADDRLAFGGRGAPYHFGSAVRPAFDRDPRLFAPCIARSSSCCPPPPARPSPTPGEGRSACRGTGSPPSG